MSLRGKTVAITRPRPQAEELARVILRLGGKPYIAPTVEIKVKEEHQPIERFIRKLLEEKVDYVIFTSVNGILGLLKISEELEKKIRILDLLNKVNVIAIGPKTKTELEKNGVKVDLVPSTYSSQAIIEILRHANLHKKFIVIPRTSKVDPYLREELEKMGAEVEEVPVYGTALPSNKSEILKLLNDLSNNMIDAITFTSSATAQNLFQIADECAKTDELRKSLKRITVIAIGSRTKRTLSDLGVDVHVLPEEYTTEAMVKAYADYIRK